MTNQYSIHEEIKCSLKAGNSCYYSVQTILSSRLLSKYLKITIYNTIILPVEIGLKQGDVFSPLIYNFALECAIRKVQETNLGLDMNDTHEVLAYAEDVNLIGDGNRTIERNADVLLNDFKDMV